MSPKPALIETQEGTAWSFFVLQMYVDVYELDAKKYEKIYNSEPGEDYIPTTITSTDLTRICKTEAFRATFSKPRCPFFGTSFPSSVKSSWFFSWFFSLFFFFFFWIPM